MMVRDATTRPDPLADCFNASDSDADEIDAQLLRAELTARLFEDRAPVRAGRFELVRLVGRGGMGRVYLARDPDLDRPVAIKILHDTQGARRLTREAHAMARINHPNVVQIYDVGDVGRGQLFIAMEFVQGDTLAAWLREKPTRDQVLDAFIQAGEGLVAAHRAGILHRDFKPANVLLSEQGRVRVTDFGLSAPGGQSEERSASAPEPAHDSLTCTGTVLGTPAYMAPEQRAAGELSEAADQFSFCVACLESLYGQRPNTADGPTQLARQLQAMRGELPQRERPHFDVLARGLRWEPAERWPTMSSLLRSLRPRPSRWPRLAMLGALGTGLIGVGVITSETSPATPPPTSAGAPTAERSRADFAQLRRIDTTLIEKGLPAALILSQQAVQLAEESSDRSGTRE